MLNLERNAVLERFEFSIKMSDISLVDGWICGALRTITSPLFNEFVIWFLGGGVSWSPMNIDGWKVVDGLLETLAKRNPDFRVVLIGHGDWPFIASYLPLVRSRGLLRFRYSREENRFKKSGVLAP